MTRAHVVTISMIVGAILLAIVTVVVWVLGQGMEPAPGTSGLPRAGAPAVRPPPVPPPAVTEGTSGERSAVPAVPSDDVPTAPRGVRGRVIDPAGSPQAGLEVGVLLPDDLDPVTARSGEDGTFHLVSPFPSCQIAATEPGWTTLRLGEAGLEDPPALATVVATRAGSVAGTVLGPGGEPLRRARIDAFLDEAFRASLPGDPSLGIRGKWHADTDGEGAFVIERVPIAPGTRLETSCRGFRTDVRPLDEIPEAPLRIVLEPLPPEGPVIVGTVVLEDGQPASGAEVCFGPVHEHADARGAFRLECSRFDEETPLVACLRGRQPAVIARYGSTIRAASGHAASGELPPERLVIAGMALSIAGRVVDEHGEGGKGWRVALQDGTVLDPAGGARGIAEARVGGRIEVRTGARGSFELTGLADRPYTLLVSGRDRRMRFETCARSQPIPAGTRDALIVLPSAEVGDSIVGRLVTASGDPVPGASVGLGRPAQPGTAAELGLQGRFRSTTGPDGRFEIAGAPTGLLRLVASAPPILPVLAVLEPDAERSDVRLVARERRTFVFDGSAAQPLPGWIRALDGAGSPVPFWTADAGTPRSLAYAEILEGRSEMLVLGDDAREIVVGRGGRELGRVPFAALPGEVARVRWP